MRSQYSLCVTVSCNIMDTMCFRSQVLFYTGGAVIDIYNGPTGIYPLVHRFAGPRPAGFLLCCTIGFQASVAGHLLCSLAGKKFQNLQGQRISSSGFCVPGWQDDSRSTSLHHSTVFTPSTSPFPAANLLFFLTLSCLMLLFLSFLVISGFHNSVKLKTGYKS